MEFNIYGGKNVLYKTSGKGSWRPGILINNGASLTREGLTFMVGDVENDNFEEVKPENIFFDSKPLEDWMKDDEFLIEKEQFAQDIEDDYVHDTDGNGYMSDGKYYYYSIPRLNANWIRKQPLPYVVWFSR